MNSKTNFFQVGGTLEEGAPCYIERPADKELLKALDRGELCLVLAPRQTGKSSLMVNARARLRSLGALAAIVDLQPLRIHHDPDKWFNDIVYQIARSLELETDAIAWWDAHKRLGPTQRFMTFVEDVILGEIEGRVVIFFDEIDSALALPFSDDFFTTLRALFNARASRPVLKRLTFVLLGVATPSEFIKDRSRTPFNIGRDIALNDFDAESLADFIDVLGPDSKPLINRIFYWTDGQPLMVQKLSEAVHSRPDTERSIEQVDAAVRAAYLDTKIEEDTHLKFIRDYLLEGYKKVRRTLITYKAVIEGKEVSHNDQSPIHSRLKLAGVVRVENQKLAPRNRIYPEVFDPTWVKENTPRNVTKMVAYGTFTALALILIVVTILAQVDIWLRSREMNWNVLRIWALAQVGLYEGPAMVEIPGGTFLMGSSECTPDSLGDQCPQHSVTIQPFWMGKYEVTFDEYSAFVFDSNADDVKLPNDEGWGRGSRPVINVSWNDAKAYANWLSKVTGKPFRLPTEAEWEYAARAGTKTYYWWGDNVKKDGKTWANCYDCGGKGGGRQTAPVGSFPKNNFNLYDMNGNVWEWVEDDWHENYKEAPDDGRAWIDDQRGKDRVARGGSWRYSASYCRSAFRGNAPPDDRGLIAGFRLARSVALSP